MSGLKNLFMKIGKKKRKKQEMEQPAETDQTPKETFQRRPREYDEITDEHLEANNAARADVKVYTRKPRNYDEIDISDIQDNCQSKDVATQRQDHQ